MSDTSTGPGWLPLSDVVGAREQVSVSVEDDAHAGVAGAVGDLDAGGVGFDPERDSGVAQVVQQPGRRPRPPLAWEPEARAECRSPQRCTKGRPSSSPLDGHDHPVKVRNVRKVRDPPLPTLPP